MAETLTSQNLIDLTAGLLEKARGSRSGRAASGIYSGQYLRQALLTLTAGSELADHDSPPEATLQVIEGTVKMATAEESWELSAGDHIVIPRARHNVEALTDAAFLLTIRTDVS